MRPASTRFLESVVSLITWRPRCSEEAAVPVSGQSAVKGSRCFKAGTFVGRTNRLANSVQTHFFDTGSAAAVGRQGRWTQRSFVWLATGSGRWKVENFESNGCARRRCIASCAEQRTGEATYARGRKCENALELRGRAPADSPDRAMNGALRAAGAREVGLCPEDKHTGQKETALWARWGAHRERVDADA